MSSAATGTGARALQERVFEGADLAAEFPLAFEPSSGGATIELTDKDTDGDKDGGEVRAACTTLVREFRVLRPDGRELRIRAGLIGSVATDPAWRGRGLGTRLLAEAERSLRARGAVFSLLWASDPGFYLARGYAPFGVECDIELASALARSLPAASGVRPLRAGDEPSVQRLYLRHAARVVRTLDETRALLGVPGMLTLVRERAQGAGRPAEPVAYACLGRGRDLADVVHEWGGEPEDVLALLRAHLERRFPAGAAGALFLMAPSSASGLLERLVALGAPARRGILGLGKLLDLERASALLGEVLGPAAGATPGAHTLELRGPGAGVELDLDTLQALLFGGPEVHDEARALLTRLGFEHAPLPLEPFAFGLDSI